MPKRVAAIDLGTNSCHLVVTELDHHGYLVILDTHKDTIRLGQALNARNVMSHEAILKTVRTFKVMKQIADSYGAEVRAVATHATRTAVNHGELIDAILDATDIHLEIIDGPEEARLSFLGMRCGLSIDKHITVGVDIGGGSTEIIIARQNDVRFVTSLRLGTVMLSRNHLNMRSPIAGEVRELSTHITTSLAALQQEIAGHKFSLAVASSGTAKAIAMINHKLFGRGSLTNVNGYRFSAKNLAIVDQELSRLMSPRKIKASFDLDLKRSEIILAGTKILNQVGQVLGVEEWTVSTYGLREGLALDTYARQHRLHDERFTDVRQKSVKTLAQRFDVDISYARHVRLLALKLYTQMEPLIFRQLSEDMRHYNREILEAAAYLSEVGKFINYSEYHKHSQYIISNSSLLGFSDLDKHLISYIARYCRKKLPNDEMSIRFEYLRDNLRLIMGLASCLRLAKSANRTRMGRIRDVIVKAKDDHVLIILKYLEGHYPEAEAIILRSEQKAIEKGFGTPIEFSFRKAI